MNLSDDGISTANDVLMELTAVGDNLTLTTWNPGDLKPEPQITATDSLLTSGPVGVFYNEFPDSSTNPSGVFRWVEVSDSPIVDVSSADFDEDGDADGADFVAWQQGFGMTGATLADGDANHDGLVDDADRGVWEETFGTTGSNVAVAAVPEPASILLACLVMILLMFSKRIGSR